MAIGLACIADGTSMITENVFEARFRFVEEMIRLGADARTDGHHAVVRGMPQLSSAPVWASDIRAGAGLVLAGLVADGDTEVHDVFHIDRGYPLFVENLSSLGRRDRARRSDAGSTALAGWSSICERVRASSSFSQTHGHGLDWRTGFDSPTHGVQLWGCLLIRVCCLRTQ